MESAAYNLREALDTVAAGHDAAPGGFPGVRDAYERFRVAAAGPEADEAAALRALAGEIGRLFTDGRRQNHRTRELLGWLTARTGIEPLPGDDDPSAQFDDLRERANSTLHSSGTVALVAALYAEAVVWFLRVFTPPDERLRAIVELARTPYVHPDQVRLLRSRIAYNAHHLGRFLAEVQDPAWLDALFDDGLILPPRDNEPWPVWSLPGGRGGIEPADTVALLERLRTAAAHGPADAALHLDRNIIQLCLRLGAVAHRLVTTIVARHPRDHWVQRIAVHIAKDSGPDAPIQLAVADAVIGGDRTSDANYQARTMVGLLAEGLNADNAPARLKLMSLKLARLAAAPSMRTIALDIAALNTSGDDDLRDEVLIVTERFVNTIPRWRELGLPTSDVLAMVTPISGELGERIICQVLAGARDVSREAKLEHLAGRLGSPTATGDDRDLLADLGELSDLEIAQLAAAFGAPSPAPEPDDDGYMRTPADWSRAWRWSMVLPAAVLDGWEEQTAAVTKDHGVPDAGALSRRLPRHFWGRPESPYTAEEFADMPPLDAAALVAAWRPEPDKGTWSSSVWDLASALERVIAADVDSWAADPVAVVTALREPGYVERYLRVLEKNAIQLAGSIAPIMEAVQLFRTRPWEPAQLSRSQMEPGLAWEALDRTVVEMVGAFANAEADFGAHIDLAWQLTSELVGSLPDELPPLDEPEDQEAHDGAYGRAINRTYGQALQTAVSLGWLGHRRDRIAPPIFIELLDQILEVPGSVGAELRSVLAAFRPVLEHVVGDWLERRHTDLFASDVGQVAFQTTLKYSRPTPWLYEHYRTRIAEAALAGVPNAVDLPLIGYLWEIPRFTVPSILGSYKSDVEVLRATASQIASLVQDTKADDPMVARALAFWDGMLDGAGSTVPSLALGGAGRWVFVESVSVDDWISRMDRTLQLTGGEVELATEVADRCLDVQPSEAGLRMLRLMQGRGEPWERDHVGRTAVDALRSASGHAVGAEFDRLRDRLIELGFHDAAEIAPEPQ